MVCLPRIDPMNQFGKRLTDHLSSIGMTKYRLAKLSGVSEPSVVNISNGKRDPTDDVLEKLSRVPSLGLDLATLKAWRLMDEYTVEEIEKALLGRVGQETFDAIMGNLESHAIAAQKELKRRQEARKAKE